MMCLVSLYYRYGAKAMSGLDDPRKRLKIRIVAIALAASAVLAYIGVYLKVSYVGP